LNFGTGVSRGKSISLPSPSQKTMAVIKKLLSSMMRITISLLYTLIFSLAFGQTQSYNSLKHQQEILLKSVDSLTAMLAEINGCTDFVISDNAKCLESKTSKTFIRNCKRSSTYLIINSDSTFLFIYYGEGSNYLHKGKWKTERDSLINLRRSPSLTNSFLNKMKRFQSKNWKYKFDDMQLIIKPDRLKYMRINQLQPTCVLPIAGAC
jgi:hypothetical protein